MPYFGLYTRNDWDSLSFAKFQLKLFLCLSFRISSFVPQESIDKNWGRVEITSSVVSENRMTYWACKKINTLYDVINFEATCCVSQQTRELQDICNPKALRSILPPSAESLSVRITDEHQQDFILSAPAALADSPLNGIPTGSLGSLYSCLLAPYRFCSHAC